MFKALVLSAAVIMTQLAGASLEKNEVLKGLAGRYALEFSPNSSLNIVIRSSGAVQVLNELDNLSMMEGKLTFAGSTTSALMSGLPVGHLVVTQAGDEDTRDFHVLLTVEQSPEGEDQNQVKVIAAFETFNDGPNELSSVEKATFSLKKYNKATKRFETLYSKTR